MNLNQLKNKANTKLQEFWDLLIVKQETYFLKHNKFFQLLVTNPVVDGVDTTWEIRKPNDEKHVIDVDFEFNSPVPFQISVDEWVGDDRGFSATATVELPDGRKFTRTRTAIPTIVEATYAPQEDIDTPRVELTPKAITDWTIETSNWNEVTYPQI
jgi:hypothetical protein